LQRFGLKTYKQSDNRDVIYDYLTLLHSHGVDFHASLRLLSSFDPTKAGEGKYARVFAANFIGECTINLPADQVDKAIDEVEGWLSVYAGRVTEDEEVQAWTAADGESGADGGWVAARKAAMEGVNPRFVLRQWVLEELIAQLEATGVEGIDEGRAKLGRVLDVSHGRSHRRPRLLPTGTCCRTPSVEMGARDTHPTECCLPYCPPWRSVPKTSHERVANLRWR